MLFGMLDDVFFHLGPIPVDHIIVTEWVIIGLIGLIAFFATRDMQMVPRGLQNAFEMIIIWTYDFFTQLMDKEHGLHCSRLFSFSSCSAIIAVSFRELLVLLAFNLQPVTGISP